jgi:DnaJ-class molecular chaperone
MFAEEYGYFKIPDPVQAPPVARKKFRTHYDNLKVSRTATLDEIRTSCRRLRSLYHPDRNNTAKAEKAIICINEAYEVLSDAAERAKYDAWIVEEERKLNPPRPQPQSYSHAEPPKPKQTQYAQDPVGWNPEHAVEFKRFIQKFMLDQSNRFCQYSTDNLYQLFLIQKREDDHRKLAEKLKEDARKAIVLSFCCTLTLLIITAWIGYRVLT